jgi:tripartite-type tricarboxylate transporter receptor subunit TctC
VRAPLAANTLAELIALAKAQPGKLTYASSGAGGAIHLASELFKREAGVDIVHVPYRGGGPAVMGLLTGDVDIFINDASTTVENIRAGKLKALAMAWPKRSPLLPQVPTFAELGFPAVVSSSWFGLAAPADTPADISGTLAAAMSPVFSSAGYQARLEKLGLEQFKLNPDQSAAFIKAEFDKWAEVAKSARIQVE